MRASTERILTSHAGSLPRPEDLIEANRAREAGPAADEDEFQRKLRAAVADVVRRQRDLGVDVPGDGEFGKSMGQRVELRPGDVWVDAASEPTIGRGDDSLAADQIGKAQDAIAD